MGAPVLRLAPVPARLALLPRRRPQVTYLDLCLVGVEQYILRLDVTVDDTAGVQPSHRVHQLARNAQRVVERSKVAGNDGVVKVPSLAVLSDHSVRSEPVVIAKAAEAVELDDVWVVQLPEVLNLLNQLCARTLVVLGLAKALE